MAKPCTQCWEREHHAPGCPELYWADTGELRGQSPGKPPAESMTLGDEMAKIFANVKTVNPDLEA